MSRLFFYFDLWGLSTEFNSKFTLIAFVFHIILAFLATTNIIFYMMRPDDDKIARIIDFLKLSVLCVVYWLSVIELYSKKNVQRLFWQHVFTIDQLLCSHRQYTLKNYLKKTKIYFIVLFVAYALNLKRLIHNTGSKFLYFWIPYAFLLTFFKTRSFYYIFFLAFIKNELKIIEQETITLRNDYNAMKFTNRTHPFAQKFHRSRFKWIRQYYGLIYDLCSTVNTMFGCSNIVVILFSFHLILIEINWFYWKLLNKYQFNINGKWFENVHLIAIKRILNEFSFLI